MGKTLFLGCSHTIGYNATVTDKTNIWLENNYAEIYSKIFDKEVIVMALAGASNRLFPKFLAYALQNFNDIEEVYIQSTYWNRFPIAINPSLDEKTILPIDFFIRKQDSNNKKIFRFSIDIRHEKGYMENYSKPLPPDWTNFPYIKYTQPWVAEPDTRRSSFLYFRMWHHSNTHLEQEDYFSYIALCDMLCTYNNIPLYVWNINNRCFIPKETKNFYTNLKSTKFSTIDAENFLKLKKIKIDTTDGEHYTTDVHKAIAQYYIPFLKETT